MDIHARKFPSLSRQTPRESDWIPSNPFPKLLKWNQNALRMLLKRQDPTCVSRNQRKGFWWNIFSKWQQEGNFRRQKRCVRIPVKPFVNWLTWNPISFFLWFTIGNHLSSKPNKRVSRFVGAIGSPHAPGTLTSATYALAICLRPMLMHGLNLPDVDPKEAAVQAIAQAMMDVLPGLDANDPSKTTNVFRFYAAVFYSVPSLDPQSGTGIVLPLDVELWAEEFLSRLFVLLENLEGPEAHADQSHTTEKFANAGTFLSKDCVFFDWCIEGFLLKLPKALRLRAIKRIASFLLSTPIPRSSQECEKLCGIMTEVEPAAVVSLIVHPLLQSLLEDLPSTSGSMVLQKARKTLFRTWNERRCLDACAYDADLLEIAFVVYVFERYRRHYGAEF